MTLLLLADLLQRLDYQPGEHLSLNTRRPGASFTSRVIPAAQASTTGLDAADVWYGVNPVRPGTPGRGTADDISRLAGLWADLDVKAGGCPDMTTARTIVDVLADMLTVRPVAITYSGHGLQPVWALEPTPLDTDTQRRDARILLRRWGRLVAHVADIHGCAVDSVFDLPRVLRAPGTINHKSDPVAVATFPDTGRPLEVAEVLAALTAYGIPERTGDDEGPGAPVSNPTEWAWAASTCSYATRATTGWASETPLARHPWLMSCAVRLAAMHANGCLTQADHDTAKAALATRFETLLATGPDARGPGHGEIPEALSWGVLRAAAMTVDQVAAELGNHPHLTPVTRADLEELAPNTPPSRPPPGTGTDGAAPAPIPVLALARPLEASRAGERAGPTEDGAARALVSLHRTTLRYVPQRKLWLRWTGSRWEWDTAEHHRELIRSLARDLPEGEGWKTFKRRALSAAGVTGIARLAQSDAHLTTHIDTLDAHPYELNTPGGIIDLRTGTLGPPDPAGLHTRTTTVVPDFDHPSALLDDFLAVTFGGDTKLIGYVQRVLGLACIGAVLEQILPFNYGIGANGKSTLYEAVMFVLGTGETGYAIAAPSEMLMVRSHSEHPAELAQLAGARLVVCSELDDNQRFAEARIKQLTGRDSINARFMRCDPFTFTPSHTLTILGNNKPAATSGGAAFWRRVQLVPFAHVIPEKDRDPFMAEKLAAQGPALLAWLARGAADYLAGGLRTPAVVRSATAEYAHEQDTVSRFLEDRCHLAAEVSTPTRDVRTAYEQWCGEVGETPVSAKRLTQDLAGLHGLATHRSNGIRYYDGITIVVTSGTRTDPATDDTDPDTRGWFR